MIGDDWGLLKIIGDHWGNWDDTGLKWPGVIYRSHSINSFYSCFISIYPQFGLFTCFLLKCFKKPCHHTISKDTKVSFEHIHHS